jgi:4,5-dihydroxyphthalate decarboxylase
VADVEVALSVMPSLLTAPITEGEVTAKGVKLNAEKPKSIDDLTRQMMTLNYDIGEMAISTFLMARDSGVKVVALPLFTSGRRFLQAGFHFATQSDLEDLSEIKGRNVGIPQYWMSSSVWQRGMLQHHYGIAAQDVDWISYQPERGNLETPGGVRLRLDSSGRGPRELLEAGEIEVSLSTGGGPIASQMEGVARPVFPDRVAAERDYFQRTGIFPILHVTVMKEELAEREPWLASSICEAYHRAKELARSREEPHDSDSPAAGETTNQMRAIMGDDPWAYGIGGNRKALDTLVAISYEQGLTKRQYTAEELFPRELPDSFR